MNVRTFGFVRGLFSWFVIKDTCWGCEVCVGWRLFGFVLFEKYFWRFGFAFSLLVEFGKGVYVFVFCLCYAMLILGLVFLSG